MALVRGFTLTDIDRIFEKIEAITLESMNRALRKTADRFQPFVVATSSVGMTPEDVGVVTQYWQEEVNGEISNYVGEVYRGSAIHVAVGIADAFSAGGLAGLPLIPDEFTQIFLRTITGQFVNVIGNDLWESARTILIDGVQQGQSMEQIADRLQNVDEFTARRAMVVARTAVHAASESGSISQLRYVGYSNDTVVKEWINTHDSRTRPTHVAAGGQQVNLNEKFIVGEALLDHPGDPLGPPSEIYNCRCTVTFEIFDPPTVPCNAETICITKDHEVSGEDNLTAAGTPEQYRSGAMIALIPRKEDAQRLVLDGGLELDDLHMTLFFLGESDDIPDDLKDRILTDLSELLTAPRDNDVIGEVFSINVFNPVDNFCLVLGVGGDSIAEFHEDVFSILSDMNVDISQSKKPWIPHITLSYGSMDTSMLYEIAQARLGQIVFDRLRVQFGEETHDIRLNDF